MQRPTLPFGRAIILFGLCRAPHYGTIQRIPIPTPTALFVSVFTVDRKRRTIDESIIADNRYTVGYVYVGKICATAKRTINRLRDFSFFLDSGVAFIVTPLL